MSKRSKSGLKLCVRPWRWTLLLPVSTPETFGKQSQVRRKHVHACQATTDWELPNFDLTRHVLTRSQGPDGGDAETQRWYAELQGSTEAKVWKMRLLAWWWRAGMRGVSGLSPTWGLVVDTALQLDMEHRLDDFNELGHPFPSPSPLIAETTDASTRLQLTHRQDTHFNPTHFPSPLPTPNPRPHLATS